MEIILIILLWILILAFIITSFVKIKYKAFFLLAIQSFIAIVIFSSIIIFFINNWKITFKDYSLILTNWNIKEVQLKDKPVFYLSWEILSWTTFNWIVYELQWNNFIKQNNSWSILDLSNYITKSDIKDFYMDSYNKRIESMQNQINVFLSIISLIWTLLLFLWYKNFNDIDEKTEKRLKEYIKWEDWKKVIDDKLEEHIKWDEAKQIIINLIDKKLDNWIKGNIEDTQIYKIISDKYYIDNEELYNYITWDILEGLIKEKIKEFHVINNVDEKNTIIKKIIWFIKNLFNFKDK